MMAFLGEWITAIWIVLVESGPYLLAGFLIAGLIKVFVPEAAIYRHLGRDDFRSVSVASLAGVPIPLCSCSVIPTAISLKKSGASKGATTSFLISTPETGVDSIGVTWALMDPIMTVTRPLAALLSALLSGSLVNIIVRRGWDDGPADVSTGELEQAECGGPTQAGCGGPTQADCGDAAQERGPLEDPLADHDHEHEHVDPRTPWYRRVLRYAFGTLLDDLTPWFVLGFAVSGLIMVLVPEDFFGAVLPSGWLSMVGMLFIGVPLYICATASTPVAAALIAKGLDPGAALVLLLAGPATNVATIGVVQRFLGRRILASYLISIAVTALLLGAVVNWIYARLGIDPRTIVDLTQPEGHGLFAISCGVVLTVLLARSSRRLRLGASFGAWLRRAFRPLGVDPTSLVAKLGYGLLVLALYASTAFSVVRVGEVGFRLRLGAIQETYGEAGLVVHWPFPLERLERVRREEVRGLDFGFLREEGDELAPAKTPGELAEESEVLTGDENILKVTFALHYRVADAQRYRFGVGEPDVLLEALAEAGVRRTMGRRTADEILLASRPVLEDEVRGYVQEEADELSLGLEVVQVQLLYVHAPPAVHDSFLDIASAIEEAQAELQRGAMYEKNRLAKGRGAAHRILQEAQAESARMLEDARGRVNAFRAVQEADAEDPASNRLRLRLDGLRQGHLHPRLVLTLDDSIEVLLLPAELSAPLPDAFSPRPDEGPRR